MKNKGQAMMGTGEHSGENRAKIAAEMALNNPLLDNSSIDGASSILLNIKGGLDLALFEVDEAASLIRAKVNENANIIFGSSIDESLDGIINVSVVATGININQSIKSGVVIDKNINQTEASEIDDHSSKIEGQIDLESKIADLNKISNSEKTTAESEKDSLTFLENKEKELSDIFNKKNDVTEENQFLKKISNLFSNNKNKNISEKLEQDNEIYPLKDVVENEKNDEEKPLLNLNENPIKSENNSEQISLLDIDENEKSDNLDDVLEIPAFLRRQAN
jgi:cell division protein FtsZ